MLRIVNNLLAVQPTPKLNLLRSTIAFGLISRSKGRQCVNPLLQLGSVRYEHWLSHQLIHVPIRVI